MRSVSTSTKLYQDFRGIEAGAYHTLVRFYESKEKEIANLSFETYFEILMDYTNALFEIGAYAKHLEEVDKVIHLSIAHNIQFFRSEDIYHKSLFQKAASHYNLLEIQKAEHILKELIKMEPHDKLYIHFLKKCLNQKRPIYIKNTRAISIIFFLLAALTAAVEVVIVYPFSPEYISLTEKVRLTLLGSGITVLFLSFLFHRYQTYQIVNRFIQKIHNNK